MKLSPQAGNKGFSLIELLVAMGILSVLMLMLTILLDQVQKSWSFAENRIGQFREARVAFDLITKNIGQASLNTYWDLKDEDEDGLVDGYFKTSELHFISLNEGQTRQQLPRGSSQEPVGHAVFFQAPLGFSTNYRNLNSLFNGRGYFVAFGHDRAFKPSFVKSEDRYRFRLMEFRPPAEANQIFEDGQRERSENRPQEFTEWYKQAMNIGVGDFESHLNPLAENIVTLVVSPRDSLDSVGRSRRETYSAIASKYAYDSNGSSESYENPEDFEKFTQQVPPLLRATMVAIDETAAVRLESGGTMPEVLPPNLFSNTSQYDKDLETLAEFMNEKNINYKVFSSIVMMRSSKWGS
ncbi:MAG: Verru_Chthon cassette protein C [Verrucomicrobiales bacterium]